MHLHNGDLYFAEVKVTAKGNTGHSLILHENTAAEKLQTVINRLLEFRTQEKSRLESNPELTLGDVTTVNMTMLGVNSELLKVNDKASYLKY